jgi:hypothetical protein
MAPGAPALAYGASHGAVVAAARAVAMPPGGRLMIDGDDTADPITWLVAPLVAGASVVLCRHLDPERRAARLATERATPYP